MTDALPKSTLTAVSSKQAETKVVFCTSQESVDTSSTTSHPIKNAFKR